jgi:hypothetical protein
VVHLASTLGVSLEENTLYRKGIFEFETIAGLKIRVEVGYR